MLYWYKVVKTRGNTDWYLTAESKIWRGGEKLRKIVEAFKGCVCEWKEEREKRRDEESSWKRLKGEEEHIYRD